MNQSHRPLAIANAQLIRNGEIQLGKVVLVENGIIQAVCNPDDFSAEQYQLIDCANAYLTPGLVDLHIHGCMTYTFNEPTKEAFETILKKTLSVGVTTLAPTLVAAPTPELETTLDFIASWRNRQTPGMTSITGAYLESPFIAPAAKGALPENAIRDLKGNDLDILLNHHDALAIFMVAPELEGAADAFRKITAYGIIGAMGHTTAIEDQVLEAIQAGASHVTHLWSAMSSVVRIGPWRKPGLLEVALTHPEITAEIIADNRHLPPTLMKLAVKAKGDSRTLCAVSDALNGAGLPEGSCFYVGGNRCQVVDGVGMVEDRTVFAGSTTLLNREIPILIHEVGLTIPEAIAMVTEIPARILKLNHNKGKIEPRYDADLVLFDSDFNPIKVIQNGIVVVE